VKAYLVIAALLVAIAVAVWWRWRQPGGPALPRHRARHLRMRLHLRRRPGRGFASGFELWLRWGRFAAFRQSRRARPSLSVWQRTRHPLEHSVLVGRAHHFRRVRLPVEEHALILAPPRTGKTALLASVILHYPGAVVSTTTKADVFALTSGVRQLAGPVHVFNPQGVGDVLSTFRWNFVDGCQAPAVAIRRADAITGAVDMSATEDGNFWSNKAGSYLRAIFHAAALASGDARMVTRWALGSTLDAEEILAASGASQWATELGELRGEAQKTAATVRMVLSRALAFMTDPALAASVLPVPGGSLDIDAFLTARGTLYMIADAQSGESPLAPLFAALANEMHWHAAQLGSRMPGGRMDPPLLMALDEIVQVCPVPLDIWAPDSGGKGIQLVSVAHGEAQLAGRWHEHGKQVILDTASAMIVLPGVTDTGTLEMASRLSGQVPYRERGHDGETRHDVLTPDMIRRLPPGFGLIIRGGHSPVIAKLARGWRERAYRQARRHGREIARLIPAAAPLALADPAPDAAPAAAAGALAPIARLRPVRDVGAEAADVLAPGSAPDADMIPARPPSYPWGGGPA